MEVSERTVTKYSDEERGAALAVLDSLEGNVQQASKLTGIPRATLAGWNEGVRSFISPELRLSKKNDLASLMEGVVSECLGYIPPRLPWCTAPQLATVMGIATEKMLLLRGQATSRTAQELTPAQRISQYCQAISDARKLGTELSIEDIWERIEDLDPDASEYREQVFQAARPVKASP